ncbi:uracil phosphoribosyltransferase [Novimethylophilus kurashikiensis]|uniref:Uracil phosphoribosyltransferase n=1 Tax=Novimethylophilus kurashikiensis TaxID=1825523 RepID=A0A2R5F8L0_9PROT|nr:hypothetical protein [Novimethylophilus kurashikiensis]GBG14582.1 uracil phosphoribosyltransferase [Novimethylophilus kurashikiensis]
MEATKNRITRDPLKALVDVDSLRLGHELAINGAPNWAEGAGPKRPLGVVPFETARQVATFAIPVALVFGALALKGLTAGLIAIPFAMLAGVVLDAQLMRAIEKQKARDVANDRGNYARARELAVRLGLKMEDINKARITRLEEDFKLEERRLKPYALNGEARGRIEREVAEKDLARRLRALGDEPLFEKETRVGAAGQGQSNTGSAGRSHHHGGVPASHPMVNINGTPMANEFVDINGKPFGAP